MTDYAVISALADGQSLLITKDSMTVSASPCTCQDEFLVDLASLLGHAADIAFLASNSQVRRALSMKADQWDQARIAHANPHPKSAAELCAFTGYAWPQTLELGFLTGRMRIAIMRMRIHPIAAGDHWRPDCRFCS
jgi:hypothetical protein